MCLTYPFVDVHLKCFVVEWEEISVRASGFITCLTLKKIEVIFIKMTYVKKQHQF